MNEQNGSNRPNFFVRIFLFFFRIVRFFFTAIGVFAVCLPIAMVYMLTHADEVVKIGSKTPKVGANESVLLELKLSGSVAETAPDSRFEMVNRLFGSPPHLYLPDLVHTLERAAVDARVKGMFVEIEDLHASLATVSELREAIVRFKAAGKAVHFHMTDGNSAAFYLATSGDKIEMVPAGSLEIPGPMFQLTYMSSALAKLGVEFQVVRAGKYKSAMEPLISDGPSPATLEMMGAMEESLRGHLADTIGPGRQKAALDARAWLKRGLFTAHEALAAGMVDNLSYSSDHQNNVKQLVKADTVMKLGKYDVATEADDPTVGALAPSEEIGLIEAAGEIVMSDGGSGEAITPKGMAKAFKWAREDAAIKAVVFRISSPGGSALASDMIWEEVRKTNAMKPVIVSMGSTAASGGYYVAAPAAKILAEPTTITGSIGVIAGFPKLTGFKEKWGLTFYTVTQSDRGGLYSPAAKASPDDEALLASHVDHTYKMFVEKVAEGRKLDPQKVYGLAEGRVYTGLEALHLGLVDSLGGYFDAVKTAVELAKLDPSRHYPVTLYKDEKDVLDCLSSFKNLKNCAEDEDAEMSLGLNLMAQIKSLAHMFEHERVLTRMPLMVTDY